MGFLQNLVQGGLNTFDKYDPVNSALFNGMIDVDSASVRETMNSSEHFWDDQEKKYAPGFLRGIAGGLRNNSQHWSEMAQKDNDNHARAITNAGLTFAALYGATGGWGTGADVGAEAAAGGELGADGYLAGGGYGAAAGAGSLGGAATAFGKGYAGGSAGAAAGGADQDTIFRSGLKGGAASAIGQGAGAYTGNNTFGGAVSGGANAAMNGGSVLKGAATGGIGANSPDISGDYVTNPGLKDAINKGVTQGGLAAMNGGNWKSAAVSGAVPGLFSYGANQMGFNDTTDSGYNMDPFQKAYGDSTSQSRAPWANDYSNGNFGIQPNYATQSSQTPWAYSGDGGYGGGGETGGNPIKEALLQGLGYGKQAYDALGGGPGIGHMAQGLAGLYTGYKQQKMARGLMRGMDQRRNAYQQQLQSNLARKDALAGRRSDYGGREVALQSALADLDARNAPAMMGLQGARLGGLMGMFNSGLTTAQRFGAFNPSPMQPYQPNIPAPMSLPQMYQPQQQLDPTNWDRQRRPDQFGA